MDPIVTIAVAIFAGILASAFFSWVQTRQRGVPASEQGLLNYIRQLEGERTELRATVSALQQDIKFREKERELLRDERQDLNYKIALLQQKVEFLERDLRERIETTRTGGISASGNANLSIGRDATGGNKQEN